MYQHNVTTSDEISSKTCREITELKKVPQELIGMKWNTERKKSSTSQNEPLCLHSSTLFRIQTIEFNCKFLHLRMETIAYQFCSERNVLLQGVVKVLDNLQSVF